MEVFIVTANGFVNSIFDTKEAAKKEVKALEAFQKARGNCYTSYDIVPKVMNEENHLTQA